jgi:hypothetical protein
MEVKKKCIELSEQSVQKHQCRRNIDEKLPNNESCVYSKTPNKTFDSTGGKLLQKNKPNMMDTTVNLTVSFKNLTHLLSVSHTPTLQGPSR